MRSGNKRDISAFLLGAASQAAHFFPLCLNAEARWMRYQRFRSLGVFFGLALLGGLLAWHLYVLQFDERLSRTNIAEVSRRWHSYDRPQGKRGNILFRDGTLLAGNRKVARVLVEPKLLPPSRGALALQAAADPAVPAPGLTLESWSAVLGGLVGQDPARIELKANQPGKSGVLVAEGLSLDQARQVSQARLPGVFLRYYYERDYPHGDFGAAATVGYAGREAGIHRTGLERYWDDQLQGADGEVQYARDRFRRRLPASVQVREPAPGADITTTLDPAVQLICESELRTALKRNRSEWACILVMEPGSGEVRGAATWPTFDPNEYVRGKVGSELNVLTQRVVEPGSTIKPLLAAMAIDRGWVPAGKRYVCTRHLTINGYTIREAELDEVIGGPGGATLEDIIVHSSNIGMAQLALDLKQQRVTEAYTDYGFFQKSGIELPGESKGLRPHGYAGLNAAWPRVTLANTGFGQGLAVTPLQLATAYCTLANGGYRVSPTLLLNTAEPAFAAPGAGDETLPHLPSGESLLAGLGIGTARAQSERVSSDAPTSVRTKTKSFAEEPRSGKTRILSAETCALLSGWLAEVVKSGTGKQARLDRYHGAGKTGTAQVPSPRGGYRQGEYTASFAGYFPAENPRYVVLVMFGGPSGEYYGGAVAAPVFKQVADRISYLQGADFGQAPAATGAPYAAR